jgi:hypothetical protein
MLLHTPIDGSADVVIAAVLADGGTIHLAEFIVVGCEIVALLRLLIRLHGATARSDKLSERVL